MEIPKQIHNAPIGVGFKNISNGVADLQLHDPFTNSHILLEYA
jgi:hypothetical protein